MRTPKIELIFDADCPNVEQARAHLRAALESAGLAVPWSEWDRASPSAPRQLQRYASPTVLVNGTDVAGESELSGGIGCRVYASAGGVQGAPPPEMILRALSVACHAT